MPVKNRKITIEVSPGQYDLIAQHCEQRGEGIAPYCRRKILEAVDAEAIPLNVALDPVTQGKLQALATADGMALGLWVRLQLQARARGL